jgi:hypothetical protein
MTDQPDDEITTDTSIPVLETHDSASTPPPIDPQPVEGAADLPADVKNGEIPEPGPDSDDGSDIHTED